MSDLHLPAMTIRGAFSDATSSFDGDLADIDGGLRGYTLAAPGYGVRDLLWSLVRAVSRQ